MIHNLAAGPMGRIAGRGMGKAFQDQHLTVYIKGSKMAHIGDATSTIIDVDAGTITSIQNERHTYSVTTFDQMEQMMNRGRHGQSAGDMKFDIKFNQPTIRKLLMARRRLRLFRP